tara:strand:- start:47 stop:1522 length:1476 start_codon:yes stop_codon:yes gene_type:complete
MTKLTESQFKNSRASTKPDKIASSGDFNGETRAEIIKLKIKKGNPFILDSNKQQIKITKLVDKLDFEYFPWRLKTSDGKMYSINQMTKDEDFGGSGGKGASSAGAKQAENTPITESGQAYYFSLVFNVIKKTLTQKDCTNKNLKEAAKYVEATTSLKKFLDDGPESWLEGTAGNVYMNTANKVYEKYKGKFKGNVICHRGSTFMNNLYEAFKSAKKLDEKEDNLAPGSFKEDKWNPGDVWLTTFGSNETPLKECRNFDELRTCVLNFAGLGTQSKEVKLLAVSLKKSETKDVVFKEFNTSERTQNLTRDVKYGGFSYGKSGDFFKSNDVYLYAAGTANRPIQFRAFNVTKSWQGNVIGTGALGGKIGGGNIDYYLKKQKGLKGWDFGTPYQEKPFAILKNKDFDEMYELYAKYIDKQKIKSPEPLLSKAEFHRQRKEKPQASFTFQKYMGLKLIDAVEQLSAKGKQNVILEMVRYAMSNTDISTYFVKLGE